MVRGCCMAVAAVTTVDLAWAVSGSVHPLPLLSSHNSIPKIRKNRRTWPNWPPKAAAGCAGPPTASPNAPSTTRSPAPTARLQAPPAERRRFKRRGWDNRFPNGTYSSAPGWRLLRSVAVPEGNVSLIIPVSCLQVITLTSKTSPDFLQIFSRFPLAHPSPTGPRRRRRLAVACPGQPGRGNRGWGPLAGRAPPATLVVGFAWKGAIRTPPRPLPRVGKGATGRRPEQAQGWFPRPRPPRLPLPSQVEEPLRGLPKRPPRRYGMPRRAPRSDA